MKETIVAIVNLGGSELARDLCSDSGSAFFIRPTRRYGKLSSSSRSKLCRAVGNDDVAVRSDFTQLLFDHVEEGCKHPLFSSVQPQTLSRPSGFCVLVPQSTPIAQIHDQKVRMRIDAAALCRNRRHTFQDSLDPRVPGFGLFSGVENSSVAIVLIPSQRKRLDRAVG